MFEFFYQLPRGAFFVAAFILAFHPECGVSSPSVDLQGKAHWVAVMYGPTKDPAGDSQAGAADTDIVGDAIHGSLYTAYDDNGTASTADDSVVFRLRINNPTATNVFSGVAVVGIDANLDGRVDLFISIDGRKSVQAVQLLDPGTGMNNSPSSTTTSPLPAGWLANNGVYPITTNNYSVLPVNASDDPHWNGNADLGNDGKTDVFVSWRIPMADLAAMLAKPSPVDRSGAYGPRGPNGISGFTKDTLVGYVAFTQTQPGPINGDIDGVGASYDKNAVYSSLGALTQPMSASAPVADGPSLSITQPAGGSLLNGSQDQSFSVSGASAFLGGRTLTLSVTDSNTVVSANTTIGTDGTWSVANLNLSALTNGMLTLTALVDPDGDPATTNNVSAAITIVHNKTPPAITFNLLAGSTVGAPTLTGTSDLPDGSILTLNVDPDNNPTTSNLVYVVAVSGGVWSLNLAAAAPLSGTMPSAGLTSYAKITASGTDAAGNTTTIALLNRPTVTPLSTGSTAPVLSGTWTKIPGDVLTVRVAGATYALAPGGNTWSLNLGSAVPGSGSLGALTAGNSYDIVATVTRGAASASDTTTNELTITSVPVKTIAINGGATASTNDTTPIISGTSQNAGGYVIVRIDPNNDGNLSDSVTFSVTPDGSGNWTLDTGTATPISGIRPAAGFPGTNGIMASDSTGTVSASQVLVVALPTIAISSIISTATSNAFGLVNNTGTNANWLNMTEDHAVAISGTATPGLTVNLIVADDNGLTIATNGVAVAANGAWGATNLDLSTLDNGVLQVIASISGTAISATNSSVTHDKTAPRVFITAQSTIPKNSADISGTSELPNTVLKLLIYDTNVTTLIYSNVVTTTASGTWTTNTGNGLNLVSGGSGYVYVQVEPLAQTTDPAGNIVQKDYRSRQFVQNGAANTTQTISIGTVAGDDLISLAEISGGIQITGTTTLTSAATNSFSVSVTDGSMTNAATVVSNSSGNWTAVLSKALLLGLKTGPLTIYASVTDTSSAITVYAIHLVTLDLNNPTLTISDNVSGTATNSLILTFVFSEVVTGFTAGDVTLSSGTAGTFSGSGAQYTLQVTPPANSSGTITVTVPNGAANATNTSRPTVGATFSQFFNTTAAAAAPSLTIDSSSLATNNMPLIHGTASLQAGASVVVQVDLNNDGVADLSYSATVENGGIWSVDFSSAAPSCGSLPAGGLPAFANITATAVNAYGIGTTVVALNVPAVNSLITNSTAPTVSGTWTRVSGDSLVVTLHGGSYSVANGNLTVNSTNWFLTASSALADGYYDVAATVTRAGGGSVSDITTNELLIDTQANLAITSAAATANATPAIAGTSSGLPAGVIVTVSLDINGDGTADVTFKTMLGANGSWSVNTATAIPSSGSMPSGGLNGTVLVSVSASDPAGNVAAATQSLLVDVTPPAITLTCNTLTGNATPVLTGTSDLPPGSSITVLVDPNNDGNYSDAYVYTATVQNGGGWSVSVTNTLSGAVGIKVVANDTLGNGSSIVRGLTITAASPSLLIAQPLDSGGNGVLDGVEDDAVVIHGSSTNIPAGAAVQVTVTDGTITIADTATVGSDGSWTLSAMNLSSLADGPITVTATYTDASANTFSASTVVTHNKSGSVTIDSITRDTGVLGDFVTSATNLLFNGSAPANSTVTLTFSGAGGPIFSSNVTATSGGSWTLDCRSRTLVSGSYTLQAAGGNVVSQVMVIDTVAPVGPLTVSPISSTSTTPTLSGTACLSAGESLSVLVNGVTYRAGDGFLALTGTNWSLVIPAANALAPASTNGGFSGAYSVTASIQDLAGNTLSASGTLNVVYASAPTIALSSSPTVSGYRDSVTVSATLSGGTGTMQFITNGVNWGGSISLVGGAASASLASLPRGTNVISAVYSGDANYLPATNMFLLVVTNHPPLASNPTYSRNGLNRWRISLSGVMTNATDPDLDGLTLASVSASTNGIALVQSGGYLQYFNPNQVDDQFACVVADGYGGTNQMLITLLAAPTGETDGGLVGQYNTLTVQNGQVTVRFAGVPGYRYQIQRSVDLTSWVTLATTNAPTGGLFQFLDSNPPQPSAYYRLLWNGN